MDDNTQTPVTDDQVQGDSAVPATPVIPAVPVIEEPGIEEELIPAKNTPSSDSEEESFEDIDSADTSQV